MATKAKKAAQPSINFGHIMVDLETLGTRADSVIMSIGAVKFNLDGTISDKAFYSSISIDSNHEAAQRHISEDTLAWWFNQSEGARKVFSEAKTTLYAALEDFTDWANEDIVRDGRGENDVKIWSNGADFDVPMLAHAYHVNNMTAPWKFWNTRCFRTIKSMPAAKSVPKPQNNCAHNALQDALTQAQYLIEINKVIQL